MRLTLPTLTLAILCLGCDARVRYESEPTPAISIPDAIETCRPGVRPQYWASAADCIHVGAFGSALSLRRCRLHLLQALAEDPACSWDPPGASLD